MKPLNSGYPQKPIDNPGHRKIVQSHALETVAHRFPFLARAEQLQYLTVAANNTDLIRAILATIDRYDGETRLLIRATLQERGYKNE